MRPILSNADRLDLQVMIFEETWGRKPKVWTIEMLYTLWKRARERYKYRHDERSKCIDEIVEKITPDISKNGNKNPDYIVYYKNKEIEGKLNKLQIRYLNDYKSYGVSYQGQVGDTDNIIDKRDDIISSLIEGDLKLELGTKYKKIDNLSNTFIQDIIFKYLWGMIETELKKRKIKEKIFEVNICGDDYFIQSCNKSYYTEYSLVEKPKIDKIMFN